MSEFSKQYEAELLKTGLSKKEVSTIIESLEMLVKKGVTKTDIKKIVDKIGTDSTFRQGFLKDPTTMVGKFGDVTF